MATQKNKNEEVTISETEHSNTIKVGSFQLQTKSFWIGLVAILCLFMLAVIWLNSFYWYKICNNALDTNRQLIEKYNNDKGTIK